MIRQLTAEDCQRATAKRRAIAASITAEEWRREEAKWRMIENRLWKNGVGAGIIGSCASHFASVCGEFAAELEAEKPQAHTGHAPATSGEGGA
jgi:hypothetical protein